MCACIAACACCACSRYLSSSPPPPAARRRRRPGHPAAATHTGTASAQGEAAAACGGVRSTTAREGRDRGDRRREDRDGRPGATAPTATRPRAAAPGARARLQAQDRPRPDRLVRVPVPGGPQPGRQARDRRPDVLDVPLLRERPSPRHRDRVGGARVCAVRRRGPRRRRNQGDRRGRYRSRRRLRVERRPARGQARLAGVREERRADAGGAGPRGGRPARGRQDRGRRDDDQHVPHGIPGVRVRLARPALPTAPGPLPRLAAVQPAARRGERQGLQRPGQHRLRDLWPQRRHRAARGRQAAGHRRHLRQPPDQRVPPRRHVGARLPLVHQPRQPVPGTPARLGPVHPLAQPEGRGLAHALPRALAVGGADALAAVVGVTAVDRRPRQRRAQRGGRRPDRGEAHPLPDPGAGRHGARQRAGRRCPLGPAPPRFHHAAADRQAPAPRCRGLVSPGRRSRPGPRRPEPGPEEGHRLPGQRRVRVRRLLHGEAAVALRVRAGKAEDLRLRGGRGRPQPGRRPRAGVRRLRPEGRQRAPRGPHRRRQARQQPQAARPAGERQRRRDRGGAVHRRPRRQRHARDRHALDRPRPRRLHRSGQQGGHGSLADGPRRAPAGRHAERCYRAADGAGRDCAFRGTGAGPAGVSAGTGLACDRLP